MPTLVSVPLPPMKVSYKTAGVEGLISATKMWLGLVVVSDSVDGINV
jgi:hypothetical protein